MPDIENFIERVKTDEALQAKLKTAVENYDGDKKDRATILKEILLPIAADEGFSITLAEIEAEVQKIMTRADGAEISADELKSVTGGTSCLILGIDETSGNGGWCAFYGSSGDDSTYCVIVGKD